MRVGMISPYSLTVPGGVQNQILGLARALRARGVSVRVLGRWSVARPEPFVTPLGNSVPTGANGSIVPLAPDPAAQLRTIRALRDEEFDVLHLHEPMAPGPTMTALLLKPAPVVATFHSAGTSLAYDVFRPLVRKGAWRIGRWFAVSPEARDLAHRALGGEYEIVFNGVDMARYRAGVPAKTQGPTILFVGRHEPRKGLDVLLEAMTTLGPEVRLWVGGDGPDRNRLLTAYAGDPRIEWLGELDDAEKVARLRAADVFCAPSLGGESFGIVLLEAMAAGTAVVASDLDGYARVARSGIEAELVPPGDPARLAQALRHLLDDTVARERLVDAGSERVERFSMRRLAAIYEEAYTDLVGRRPIMSRF